jgi:hypothetical protein
VLLDGALGEDEGVGDRGVALALGDLGEDLVLAAGEVGQGERSTRSLAATSGSTIFESSTEPPAATASIAATSWARSWTRSLSR